MVDITLDSQKPPAVEDKDLVKQQLLDQLHALGGDDLDILAELRTRNQTAHKAAINELRTRPSLTDAEWTAYKEWLFSSTPVYGVYTDYLIPALEAARNDDQLTFQRLKDLLFKAVATANEFEIYRADKAAADLRVQQEAVAALLEAARAATVEPAGGTAEG